MAYAMRRVFCAAPDGLEEERRAFHDLISEVNAESAMARGVLFVAVSIVPRMKKLAPFRTLIEQNIRDASFYVQVLANDFGASERDFGPVLEIARGSLAPPNIAVLLKAAPPGTLIDSDAARFRSELRRNAGLPWYEYRHAHEFRARLRDVLGGWLARVARFELRPAIADDEPFVYNLVTGAMAERLAAFAWEPTMRGALLRMQYEAATRGYAEHFPHAEHSIVLVEGQPAGHIIVARSHEELRIVDIVIAPQFRGNGLGAGVLETYLEEADRSSRRARLQVALSNPAIRLYKRLGFEQVGGDEVNLELERSPAKEAAPVT
ncbi:MAG TPA: GNAT family N-acetyltransferase [Bryobacteraceae bacterium]|nr:GNAT family N-acetyltransferase [Bryobacteraceae bacterium]